MANQALLLHHHMHLYMHDNLGSSLNISSVLFNLTRVFRSENEDDLWSSIEQNVPRKEAWSVVLFLVKKNTASRPYYGQTLFSRVNVDVVGLLVITQGDMLAYPTKTGDLTYSKAKLVPKKPY